MRRAVVVAPVLTLALVVVLAGPASAGLELGLGLLLAAGALAVWWARYRPRHARA
jgi:hypothetical protein